MPKTKIFLLFFLVILASGFAAYRFYTTPLHNYKQEVTINIEPGMPANKIISQLAAQQLISSPLFFKIIIKLKGLSRKLKAGEYEFHTQMTPQEIISILEKGQIKLYSVTLPEGLTVKEIAAILASKNLVNYEEFLASSRDPVLLEKYHIGGESVEGYLYPDTYLFSKGISAHYIMETILNHFQKIYASHWASSPESLSQSELITLASIIEKEAKKDEERPIIASVFLNRLNKNMRLESCATVIYALGYHKEQLSEEDLLIDSPYNTYRHLGLPPGPICSPGAKSIEAVLHPSEEDYLYFVVSEDGRHHFSRTFKEHILAKKNKDRL